MIAVTLARNGILFLVAWETMSLCAYVLVSFELRARRGAPRGLGLSGRVARRNRGAACAVRAARRRRSAASRGAASRGAAAGAGTLLALALARLRSEGGDRAAPRLAAGGARRRAVARVGADVRRDGEARLLRAAAGRCSLLGGVAARRSAPSLAALGLARGARSASRSALSQRDLKRALAHSSVENLGLIGLGLGIGLARHGARRRRARAFGLAAGLFHVWNHAAMKGLHVLRGGRGPARAPERATSSASAGCRGAMPRTALLFAAGRRSRSPRFRRSAASRASGCSISACSHAVTASSAGRARSRRRSRSALLAFVGALAAAGFVRLFGIVFLGQPRSDAAERAHDVGGAMLGVMGALARGCASRSGSRPPSCLRAVARAARRAARAPARAEPPLAQPALALAPLPGLALALWAGARPCCRSALALRLRRGAARSRRDLGVRLRSASARMQYTALSFAQPFRRGILPRMLAPRIAAAEADTACVPAPSHCAARYDEPILARGYEPLFAARASRFARLRLLQQGNSHLYVAYIMVAVVAALDLGVAARGTRRGDHGLALAGVGSRSQRAGSLAPVRAASRTRARGSHRSDCGRSPARPARRARGGSSRSSGRGDTVAFAAGLPGGAVGLGLDALSAVFLLPVAAGHGGVQRLLARLLPAPRITRARRRGCGSPSGSPAAGLMVVLLARHALVFLARLGGDGDRRVLRDHSGGARPRGARRRLPLPGEHAREHALPARALRAALRRDGIASRSTPLRVGSIAPATQSALFALALVGFGLKAGLVPLHVWLPPRARGGAEPRLGAALGRADQVGHLRDRARRLAAARRRRRGGARRCSCSASSRRCSASRYALAPARPEAPARLSQHREHRHHRDRPRARARSAARSGDPEIGGARARRRAPPRRESRAVQGAAVPRRRRRDPRDAARARSTRWAGSRGAMPRDARCSSRRRRRDLRAAAAERLRERALGLPRACCARSPSGDGRGLAARRARGARARAHRRARARVLRQGRRASCSSARRGSPARRARARGPAGDARADGRARARLCASIGVGRRSRSRAGAGAPPAAIRARARRAAALDGARSAASRASRSRLLALVRGGRGSRCARGSRGRRREPRATWDCGYAAPTRAHAVLGVVVRRAAGARFRAARSCAARARRRGSRGSFPGPRRFHSEVPDAVLDRIAPARRARVRATSSRWLRVLQQGSVHAYLLYVLLALVALLAVTGGSRMTRRSTSPLHVAGPARCSRRSCSA